jgi:NAD(P)H-dependent flavin oxidoreductase YrpB (nitropropane dioxygenase family)
MGTRFVTTDECDASTDSSRHNINAAEKDIVIIKSPVGMPGRAILSGFIQKVKDGKKHHCRVLSNASKPVTFQKVLTAS